MIGFVIENEDDLADALVVLVDTAAEVPGSYEVGPFSDSELLNTKTIFVEGADEVEVAEVLGIRLAEAGVRFDGT